MRQGASLLEVLGVLLLLGLGLLLGFEGYAGLRARALLEGDARAVAQAFAAARAEAKRAHAPVCLQVEAGGYRLGYPCGSGGYRSFAVARASPSLSVTYSPPYGTADQLFASLLLAHKDIPGLTRRVNLVGPLGKAVVR